MTTQPMGLICPRCEGGGVRKWLLRPTGERISMCEECDAMWLDGVAIEHETFTDFEDFLASRGMKDAYGALEEIVATTGDPDHLTP